MKKDFDGNGKANILITSPWGLGIMESHNDNFVIKNRVSNNTRIGDWLLNTKDNNVELKGDFDGDNRSEILVSSPRGIGILKLVEGSLTSIAMAQNGTKLGDWIVDTSDNQFLFAADFDGDGKQELLVTNPRGLGMLKYAHNGITSLMLKPNGTRLGEWLLNTRENIFTLVGDFDGDGQTEILVTSPWGIGILKFKNDTLISIATAAKNNNVDGWIIDPCTNRFEAVGDFDGDGKTEILVSNKNSIGILKLQNHQLTTIAMVHSGTNVGSWVINSLKDKVSLIGDFDRDGREEILISSKWGWGVFKFEEDTLQSTITLPNGTLLGNWTLNAKDNRINYGDDFDGDGFPEILITSPRGIGILKYMDGTFKATAMASNETRIGEWFLNTSDNDFKAGNGRSYGLIIHHSDWDDAVKKTTTFLKNRGYTVLTTTSGSTGISILKKLSLHLKPSDKLFVYLAGHGHSQRKGGDRSQNASLHYLQFGDGKSCCYDQFASLFELIGDKSGDLIVINGASDGGESVLCAMGKKYLAMSTTSLHAPGLTNKPNPSKAMKNFGKPAQFGLWWSEDYTASLLTAMGPTRFYQKIYRNDDTEINRLSLLYRPGISFYTYLGDSWHLGIRGKCYLYKYIYPDEYNTLKEEEKKSMTNSTSDYIAMMRKNFNNFYSSPIEKLKAFLSDNRLIDVAAKVYAHSFPRPWKFLFGDTNTNAKTEYSTLLDNKFKLSSYAGVSGFKSMLKEVSTILHLLEIYYDRQEALLKNIDAQVSHLKLYKGVLKNQLTFLPKIEDYVKYNQYYLSKQTKDIDVLKNKTVDITQLGRKELKSVDAINIENSSPELVSEHIDVGSKAKPEIVLNYNQETLDRAITQLKETVDSAKIILDRLYYLLIIVEESISKAQSKNIRSGELICY